MNDVTAATVKQPLFDIDCEAIVAAADKTWPDKIVVALSPEFAAATSDFIVDVYGAREIDRGGGNYFAGARATTVNGSAAALFSLHWL